jgi:hypothetical protein
VLCKKGHRHSSLFCLNVSVFHYLYQCSALINRFYAICISALLEFVSFALFISVFALINRFYAICISALLEFVSFALFTPKTAA